MVVGAGWCVYGGGQHEGAGEISGSRLPQEAVAGRLETQRHAEAELGPETTTDQILFGDLHVHTTFSADAFMRSVPLMGGEGAHPPADACDFARFCSGLDFFALTDHAEGLTPEHWRESLESIRRCNEIAGDPDNPDLVAFAGFEWSQVGQTPQDHYGHKNVIFKETDPALLPARPIGAPGFGSAFRTLPVKGFGRLALIPIHDFRRRQRYLDLFHFMMENRAIDECPAGIDTRELPADCREVADTPAQLYEKLAQWGLEALVIPHGTTWGFYTPPGYVWDKQLAPGQDDPARQALIEVYSGHGSSEEYRPFVAYELDADGQPICPEPREDYEPCCWRAGEIIRSRCGDAPAEECARRVGEARENYLAMGVAGHVTVPGASVEDWGDCGQCRDCFVPAFNYRPGGSVQYVLARGHFEGDGPPRHVQLGFIASSDNHTARPGTGYKEFERRRMTEATGPVEEVWHDRVFGPRSEPEPESRRLTVDDVLGTNPFQIVELERQASFFMTGGLVAVHSRGRGRDAIWDALARREVYGTSGPRILLWFDLMSGGRESTPMGSSVRLGDTPRFRVRAVGAMAQRPGCPDWSTAALDAERLRHLCLDECHNPSDERTRITRIEVVRILPQRSEDEPVESLVQSPWQVLPCPAESSSCTVDIEDPDFVPGGRDAVYYVRAIQEPTPAVNGGGLRCERVEGGRCVRVRPCFGDWRTPLDEDCLTEIEERAWSSPIYVAFDAEAARAREQDDGEPTAGVSDGRVTP